MSYRPRLIADKVLATAEYEKLMRPIKYPTIYGKVGTDEEEYAALPDELRVAFSRLCERAEKGGDDECPPGITLLGDPGVGKSKAIYSMARHLVKEYWMKKELFSFRFTPMVIEQVEWTQLVRQAARFGDSSSRLAASESIEEINVFPGFLFVDDIGVSQMPDFISEQFYLLVDQRLKNWKPTIFVSNATPESMANQMDARITHRLVRWTRVITYPK